MNEAMNPAILTITTAHTNAHFFVLDIAHLLLVCVAKSTGLNLYVHAIHIPLTDDAKRRVKELITNTYDECSYQSYNSNTNHDTTYYHPFFHRFAPFIKGVSVMLQTDRVRDGFG